MDEICVFTWSSALMMVVYRMVMVWRFCGIVLYTGLIHRPKPYVACSCLVWGKIKVKGRKASSKAKGGIKVKVKIKVKNWIMCCNLVL